MECGVHLTNHYSSKRFAVFLYFYDASSRYGASFCQFYLKDMKRLPFSFYRRYEAIPMKYGIFLGKKRYLTLTDIGIKLLLETTNENGSARQCNLRTVLLECAFFLQLLRIDLGSSVVKTVFCETQCTWIDSRRSRHVDIVSDLQSLIRSQIIKEPIS